MNKFTAFIFVIMTSVWLISCQGGATEPTDETCSYFHTGTFKYVGSEDIRIERTSEQQIEYNLNGEGGYIYTDYYAVTWTSDCEYYLTLDSTDHQGDLGFTNSDTMWVKINAIQRTGYSFIAVKGDQTYQGELKKTAS
jgi:hypothetical protein